MPAAHPSIPAEPSRAALENIDHLTQKICLLWGTPELNVFIRELIFDSRNGSRQGLPMEVAAEVTFLAETNTLVRAIRWKKRLGTTFSEALKAVEMEDDAPLHVDAFDDPRVSRDTLLIGETKSQSTRGASLPMGARYSGTAPATSQASGFVTLLLLPLRSKWLWVPALLFVSYQFAWPWIQTLL